MAKAAILEYDKIKVLCDEFDLKLLKEAENLGDTAELILVAQDTTRYGVDLYGEYSLVKLIRAICEKTSIPHIRLLYCYPDKITDELCDVIANNERIIKYIDIPIQHVVGKILNPLTEEEKQRRLEEENKRMTDALKAMQRSQRQRNKKKPKKGDDNG